MKSYFCLGAYTEPILFGTGEVFQGKGKGVSILSFEEGEITLLKEIPVRNPSFVCMDEERRRIYAVNEMKEFDGAFGGGVTALSYDEHGEMTVLDSMNVGGTDPCHIELAPGGRCLTIANFASGAVSVVGLDEAGDLTHEMTLFQHEGSSVNPARQAGPHAHSCIFSPDGKYLFVPDLGMDCLKAYGCRAERFIPLPELDVKIKPGSGPRYGEFAPNGRDFYLICEIGAQIEHYTYENGHLTLRETISTLPEDFAGESTCSDLHLTPDGKYLFGSNRGHDSLVSAKVMPDGSLQVQGFLPCDGRTPRNFAIDPSGRYLLCGCQDSDVINVFAIGEDGSLTKVSSFAAGSPVCIRFFRRTRF